MSAIVPAATLRQPWQIKLAISFSHSIRTPGPTAPTDPITPDAWRGSHESTKIEVIGMTPLGAAGGYPALVPHAFTMEV